MPAFASGHLTSLDLSFNKFGGALPDVLAQHRSLSSLDAKGNQLTSLPAAWRNTARGVVAAPLSYLRVSSNPSLEGGFPLGLAAYRNLTFLLISENRLRSVARGGEAGWAGSRGWQGGGAGGHAGSNDQQAPDEICLARPARSGALPDPAAGDFPALRYFDANDNAFTGTLGKGWNGTGIWQLVRGPVGRGRGRGGGVGQWRRGDTAARQLTPRACPPRPAAPRGQRPGLLEHLQCDEQQTGGPPASLHDRTQPGGVGAAEGLQRGCPGSGARAAWGSALAGHRSRANLNLCPAPPPPPPHTHHPPNSPPTPSPHTQDINVFLTGNLFPAPTPAAAGSDSSSGGLSGGAIAGIVVGSLLAMTVLAAAGVLIVRRRQRRAGGEGAPSGKFNRFIDDPLAAGASQQPRFEPATFYATAPPPAYVPPTPTFSRGPAEAQGVELNQAASSHKVELGRS